MQLLPVALVLALAVPAGAEHVATSEQVTARLLSTASERTRNVDTLVALGKTVGADLHGAVRLSDADLADLAARADRLTTDPVAGDSTVLIVFAAVGIVLIVLLLIGAAACSSNGSC